MTPIDLIPPLLTVLFASTSPPEIVETKPAPKPPRHEISLGFVGRAPSDVAVETIEGFPLTLRLAGNDDLGIGMRCRMMTPFPLTGETGWLVFSNPDGCWGWSDPLCAVSDETMLEFTVDGDAPGVADGSGNPARQAGLTDWGGGGRAVGRAYSAFDGTFVSAPYGPPTGPPDVLAPVCVFRLACDYPRRSCVTDGDCAAAETCETLPDAVDGYGFGADDDLPGLVLLSDTGVGLVRTETYEPVVPLQARNLAGFLTSVSYDLSDRTARTVIDAHLINPHRGLFSPIVQWDDCTGPPGCLCDIPDPDVGCPDSQARVDAGPVQTIGALALQEQITQWVTTVRAFVVNGPAPSVLVDLDGDGVVDADDAEAAGYVLLSGQEVARFRQVQTEFGFGLTIAWDFDGSGNHIPVLPATVGSFTKVPR